MAIGGQRAGQAVPRTVAGRVEHDPGEGNGAVAVEHAEARVGREEWMLQLACHPRRERLRERHVGWQVALQREVKLIAR
jgi:hypothetical protein